MTNPPGWSCAATSSASNQSASKRCGQDSRVAAGAVVNTRVANATVAKTVARHWRWVGVFVGL
jgi:hypothetical protein